jgi:hypothetical protein
LGSKTEPAYSILSPERDTAFSIWSSESDPAFNILATHDYPAFSILGNNYQSMPAFSILGSTREGAFSNEGGKRDSAFYPWGGKRDPSFYPWGGKKDLTFSNGGEKTDPLFSSSGDKRDAEIPDWEHKTEVTKRRARFSSWGRERFVDGDKHEKRRFSSWGGKRGMTKPEVLEEKHPENGTVHAKEEQDSGAEEIKDAGTNSSPAESYQKLLDDVVGKIQLWSKNIDEDKGKSGSNVETSESEERNQNNHRNAVGPPEFSSFVTKRSVPRTSGKNRVGKAFSPWGGKRSHVPSSLFAILGSMRRPDSPGLSDLLSKRGGYRHMSLGSKKWDPSEAGAVFSSWGGKRSVKLAGHNALKVPPQSIGRQFRRGADFYSWGGKR